MRAAHNLPAELTTFIGREAELADLEDAVGRRRLVSLTGVGGCGKTRLARRLAHQIAPRWPDGVWLVDLGSLTDPELVPGLVAATVAVPADPVADPVRALTGQLAHRRMLLCFDTCEHLLDACAALAEAVLHGCPDVSILATSREPLGVPGEAVWRVPSLRPSDAVQLFADRAGLVDPRFELAGVMADVEAVCARVDHIPLAIELAAAWVRALSPAQIAAGLDDSLRLLAGGPRRALPRHRTLQASMAWSYALLAEDEGVLFRRLAVFSGTFTLDAVARICLDAVSPAGASDGLPVITPHPGVLRLMGRLLDSSLVTVRNRQDEIRYRLLDTIRQYAEEQLRAAGEAQEYRDRHLAYFLDLAETAEPGLDIDQDRWRPELDSHRDNISAALHWGLAPPGRQAERARRLAAAMARQWFVRGQSKEGSDFLRRAAAFDSTDRSALQARLLCGIAMLASISGDLRLVAQAAERGLEIATAAGDKVSRARCLMMAAYPLFYVDFTACYRLTEQARAAGEAAGDPFSRDWATVLGAYCMQTRNRLEEAVALGRQAFDRSHPRGDRFTAAFARGVEIFVDLVGGDARRAVAIAEEVVDIAAPLGDYFAVGTNTANAAQAIGMAGDIPRARAMMDPLVRSLATVPDADIVGFMVGYGQLHLWDGDLAGAVTWFGRGVRRMSDETADWTATRCLPGLVGALRRLGRDAEAAARAEQGVAAAAAFDAPYELCALLDEQAWLARETDPVQARHLVLEALTLRRKHGLRTCYADSLEILAALEADAGGHAEAVRLLAAADAARDQAGYPRPPVDRADHDALVVAARAALGAEPFQAAWADGLRTPVEDRVAALTRGRGPRGRPTAGWDSLTPTEVDVVQLVRIGLSNPEIAARLYVSRSTVKAHLAHIFAKVGVVNRTELATQAGTHLDA